jgi:hypothetical protein
VSCDRRLGRKRAQQVGLLQGINIFIEGQRRKRGRGDAPDLGEAWTVRIHLD